jgi:hypothetical protein
MLAREGGVSCSGIGSSHERWWERPREESMPK